MKKFKGLSKKEENEIMKIAKFQFSEFANYFKNQGYNLNDFKKVALAFDTKNSQIIIMLQTYDEKFAIFDTNNRQIYEAPSDVSKYNRILIALIISEIYEIYISSLSDKITCKYKSKNISWDDILNDFDKIGFEYSKEVKPMYKQIIKSNFESLAISKA